MKLCQTEILIGTSLTNAVMGQIRIRSFIQYSILLSYFLFASSPILACTIVSAIASDGQVWNANNEDGPFGVANFINVFQKSENVKYGYYTLSYFSPAYGQGGGIQGGMNEAGLTFDFNAISWVEDFDPHSKKTFPDGDDAILPHILATMDSVEEVISFFETYWFQNGFRSAQMHVADRQGRFAIISASGIKLVEQGQSLVSTNFDICRNEDSSRCWRFPIATSKLDTCGAGLSTMMSISLETAQKNGGTMYSNIQNLTTGDVWFFSKHDPDTVIKTNIDEMLSKGRRSYTFSDLESLIEDRPNYRWVEPKQIELPEDVLRKYTGTYQNSFVGKIFIQINKKRIQLSFGDGRTAILYPISSNVFSLPDEDVRVEFNFDIHENRMEMSLHENGYWSFTAWETL